MSTVVDGQPPSDPVAAREHEPPSSAGDESPQDGRHHGVRGDDLGDMRGHGSTRWAYGTFAWLIFFVVSHVVAVFLPGDDPTGDGPWGLRAYVIFNITLILMSAVGAAVVVATVRPWGRRVPRWVLLTPLWFGSVLLVVRGVPGMVESLLMATGIRRGGFVGAEEISTAELWAGLGINTYFFIGAVLLAVTTVSYLRRSRGDSHG